MQKYEVLGSVGEGAYGVVLKCRRKDTGELVAIKTFKGDEESTSVQKTIARELNALKNLRHENVVWLKEAFRRKGKLHLVFEYIQKNLLELLQASPNGLDHDTVRLYIWQLVKALNYCHHNDIIHRDIKPENLLVNPKTRKLKLCDFGFARHVQEPSGVLTDYVATRWYRSPELLLCDPDYGKPVDMWAVGCIMGELIDGEPLFPGKNEIDQLYKIQLVLGALPPQHMERFKRNSRFAGLSFPKLPPRQTLPLRYLGKFDKVAIDFLTKLLCMDPHNRLTAKMALQHPYFRRLQSPAEDPRPLVSFASSNLQSASATQVECTVDNLKESVSSFSRPVFEDTEHQPVVKDQDVPPAGCAAESELPSSVSVKREKGEVTPSATMYHQQQTAVTSPGPPERRQEVDELPSQCPVKRPPLAHVPLCGDREKTELVSQQHDDFPSERLLVQQPTSPRPDPWQENAQQSQPELRSDSARQPAHFQRNAQSQPLLQEQQLTLQTQMQLVHEPRQNPTLQPLPHDDVERHRRRQEDSKASQVCVLPELRQRLGAAPTAQEAQRMREDSAYQHPSQHYALRMQNSEPGCTPPVSQHGLSHSSIHTQLAVVQQRNPVAFKPHQQHARDQRLRVELKGESLTEGPLRRQKVQRREQQQELRRDSTRGGVEHQQQNRAEEGVVRERQLSDPSFCHEQQTPDRSCHPDQQRLSPQRQTRAGRGVDQHQEMSKLRIEASRQLSKNSLCVGGSGRDLQSMHPASPRDSTAVHVPPSNGSPSGRYSDYSLTLSPKSHQDQCRVSSSAPHTLRGREFSEVQSPVESHELLHGAHASPQTRPMPAALRCPKNHSVEENDSSLMELHRRRRPSAGEHPSGLGEGEDAGSPVQVPLSSPSPFEACSFTAGHYSSVKYSRQRKASLPSQVERNASDRTHSQQRRVEAQSVSCTPPSTEEPSCPPQAPQKPFLPSEGVFLSPTSAAALNARAVPTNPAGPSGGCQSGAVPQGASSFACGQRHNKMRKSKCRRTPSLLPDQRHLPAQTDSTPSGAPCAPVQLEDPKADPTHAGRRVRAYEQPRDHRIIVRSFPTKESPDQFQGVAQSWASAPKVPLQWQCESQLLARELQQQPLEKVPLQWQCESQLVARELQQQPLEGACEPSSTTLKASGDSDDIICRQRVGHHGSEALPKEARMQPVEQESPAAAQSGLAALDLQALQEQTIIQMTSAAGGKGPCTSTVQTSDQWKWKHGYRRRFHAGEQQHQQRQRMDATAVAQSSVYSQEIRASRRADMPRVALYTRDRVQNCMPPTAVTPTHTKKSRERRGSFACSSRGSSWDGTGNGVGAADRGVRRGGGGKCRQRKTMDGGSGAARAFGAETKYFTQEEHMSGSLKVCGIPEADPEQPSHTTKKSQDRVETVVFPTMMEPGHVSKETPEFSSPASTSQRVPPSLTRENTQRSPPPVVFPSDCPHITSPPCSSDSPLNAHRQGALGLTPSNSDPTDASAVVLASRGSPPLGAVRPPCGSKQRRPSFDAFAVPQSPLDPGTLGPPGRPRAAGAGAGGGGAGPAGSHVANAISWRKVGINAGRYRVGLGTILPLYGALTAPVSTLVAAKSSVASGVSRKSSQHISSVPNGARYLLPLLTWTKGPEESQPPAAHSQPVAVGNEAPIQHCSHKAMWTRVQNAAAFSAAHQQRVLNASPQQIPVSTAALSHSSQLCTLSYSSSSTSSPRPPPATRASLRTCNRVNPVNAAGGAGQQRTAPQIARIRCAAGPTAAKGVDLHSVHVSVGVAAGTRYDKRLSFVPKTTVQGNNVALKQLASTNTGQPPRSRQHQRAGDASGSLSTAAVTPAVEAAHITRETSGGRHAQSPALSSSAPASSAATSAILPAGALTDVCSLYKDILSRSARGPPPRSKGGEPRCRLGEFSNYSPVRGRGRAGITAKDVRRKGAVRSSKHVISNAPV